MHGNAVLGSLGEAETYARQLDRGVALHTLIDRLAASAPLAEALAASEAELLHLVDAGGAMVRLGGISRCIGRTPPESVAERVLAVLLPGAGDQPRALDDLGLRYPEFADYAGDASGALVLPLGRNSGDGILWFRPERSRTVVWGGDPAGHGEVDPITGQLTPRASFAAWRETMSGHSAPWCEADILLAGELRRPLDDQVAQRTKAELVKLRCYDELTGLPNWNLLRDWLTAAAREPAAGAALLLIDVGQMKEVNETIGFGAGDALLVEAARRLLYLAEPDKLAARLGSAEFAMLLPRSDRSTAAALGERIRLALAAPYKIGGRSVEVSPTVRMLFADMGDELGLLGAVDAARAEAKARIVAQRGVETQRQKMEALGRMMGGVAHELNNMLQPIALLGQTIQKRGLFVAEGAEHLGIMLDCTRKARQIISELLAFSRPTARSAKVLDAATLLRDTLNLVVNAISPGISVSTHIAAQPLSVKVNRTAFAQIVINLATNAAAAMAGQGTLTISLDEEVGAAGEIAAQPSPAAARLCVSDTGCGMTKATLDRAFEPFFTTKAVGEGTGLGLPVVYGLVKEMGGTIALASEPGVGTTVTILIPAADGER
jgi:diguanylate cyclase (GGDEF)-like protein